MLRRLPLTFGLLAAFVIGCLSHQAAVTNSATADEVGNIVVSRRTLTAHGGRVDWCASNNLIAFHSPGRKRRAMHHLQFAWLAKRDSRPAGLAPQWRIFSHPGSGEVL